MQSIALRHDGGSNSWRVPQPYDKVQIVKLISGDADEGRPRSRHRKVAYLGVCPNESMGECAGM